MACWQVGGAYMSMDMCRGFTEYDIGRGFYILAEAMGRGTPLGTMLTSLLFGFADALSNSLQSLRVPAEFVQMIPYIATILGLVVYSNQQKPKKVKGEMEESV